MKMVSSVATIATRSVTAGSSSASHKSHSIGKEMFFNSPTVTSCATAEDQLKPFGHVTLAGKYISNTALLQPAVDSKLMKIIHTTAQAFYKLIGPQGGAHKTNDEFPAAP